MVDLSIGNALYADGKFGLDDYESSFSQFRADGSVLYMYKPVNSLLQSAISWPTSPVDMKAWAMTQKKR
jgi:hypothetical protein